MKIAILSMQRVVNYGSVLQAYSLREMIREIQGDIPVFLDIEDAPALKSRMTVTEMAEDYADRKQMSDGILMRGKRWLTVRLSRYNKRLIRAFMEKELHLDSLNSGRQYDAVVIGSDEVFNHAKGVRLQLHGDVRQAERVITYAASCGSAKADDISADDLPRLRTAVDRIEGMSVRDNGTEAYLSGIYSKPVIRHMDPVLMGPLYRRSVRPVAVRRYLLVYAYGHRIHKREEIEAIQAYARENGLKTVAVGGSQHWCDLYIPASPFRMLDYFAHAEAVVTDTFHGIVFSVLHQKRFAAIIRRSNENKLTSLLEELGLEDRRLSDMSALSDTLCREIDYGRVAAILEQERLRAKSYLKEHLYS